MRPAFPPGGHATTPGAVPPPAGVYGPYRGRQKNIVYMPKSTTIWVGRIASTVEVDVMKGILDLFGKVKEYKPVIDSTKGFCFVTFENIRSVLLALRVLEGLEIDGRKINVNCNSKTKLNVEEQKKYVTKNSDSDLLIEEAETIREKVNTIIKGRKVMEVNPDAEDAATEFLSSFDNLNQNLNEKPSKPRRRSVAEIRKSVVMEMNQVRDIRAALRSLEKNERDRCRKAEREIDRVKDLSQERQRQIYADNVTDSRYLEEPLQKRLPYKNSREHAERKRRREWECQRDKLDEEEEMKSLIPPAAQKTAEPDVRTASGDGKREITTKRGMSFEDEDEGLARKKEIVPIRYSEEEEKIGRRKHRNGKDTDVIRKAKRQRDLVPYDMKSLLSYDIDWEKFEATKDSILRTLDHWICSKIKDLMGEEEPSFCEFIILQIKNHAKPSTLLDNISEVLDEDAEAFVLKLYRFIIEKMR